MRNHGILAVVFAIGVLSALPASALPVIRDLKVVRVDPHLSVPANGTMGSEIRTQAHSIAACDDEERCEAAEATCLQAGGSYDGFEDAAGAWSVCAYD